MTAALFGPRAAVALAGVALVAFVIVVQPSAGALRAAAAGLAAVVSWRWRWVLVATGAAAVCLLAWTAAGLSGGHDTIVG